MELKILWRFLSIPGILFAGAIIYIVSKYFINTILTDVVGANISTWHPLAQVITPLLPIIALAIIIWGAFLRISRGSDEERRRQQGYGYPPEQTQ